MWLNTGNRERNKKRIIGTLRRTQLITTFGCGSIVDLPNDSAIVAGTDFWTNFQDEDYIIHEENLEQLLGVDYFVLPKIDKTQHTSIYAVSRDIPAFRFPGMMFCPKCQKLANYKKFGFTGKPRCLSCNRELIPSRFVIACEKGHLEDFPYSWWVHRGHPEDCSRPDDLIIYNDKKSGGLDSIKIKCNSCGKVRSMEGAFNKDALIGYKCKGIRPWLKDNDPEDCNETMRTLQRGASNLYFGVQVSALSVPPWSRKIQLEIGKDAIWNVIKNIQGNDDLLKTFIKCNKLEEKCNCTLEEVLEQIKFRLDKQNNTSNKTYEDILLDEYRALLSGNNDDPEFKTEESEVPELLKNYIDKIVLIKKLKEVMVLRGFRRIKPADNTGDNNSFTRLSKEFKNWLPAIELRGEGIFIKLNNEHVKEWENDIGDRYNSMEENMNKSIFQKSNFSPRYVLLHTLSHLLIRQLVFQCGYSSSSLKERIYSTLNKDGNPIEMEGILIYTASPDSEGSLGGLVREGQTENIDNTFRQMLENASWCSSDPLCIQSKGQGMDSLNYAACHSCALLPETSCEARNCFLDRAAIIGDLDNKYIGFFSKLFESGK